MHRWTTVACRLTPSMPAAIATVAVKGPAAVDTIMAVVKCQVPKLRLGRVHFGSVELPSDAMVTAKNEAVEQVVVCRTKEDEVELHCHGGQAVCTSILRALAMHGCVLIDSTHWTTEHDCPISAAAEADLIRATTDKVANVLVDQHSGILRRQIEFISELIRRRDVSSALNALEALWDWRQLGLHLTNSWKVVLAGPPNVGKSSLMNAIVGQSQSIVHDQPGTTRDWIEAEIALNGWPGSLMDTAGICHSDDFVEGEGVRRSRARVLAADLVVFVVDAQVGWTPTHADVLDLKVPRSVVAWNKFDLGIVPQPQLEAEFTVVATSTLMEPGVSRLLETIARTLVPNEPTCGQAIPFRASHVERIQSAIEFLRERNIEAAAGELESLTTSWIEETESP